MSPPQYTGQTHQKKETLRKQVELYNALIQKSLSADLEEFLAVMFEEIAQFLVCQAYALILIDEANKNWVIHRSRFAGPDNLQSDPAERNNRQPIWVYHTSHSSAHGLIQACLDTQQTLLSANISEDARFDAESDSIEGIQIRNMLCAPLVVNSQSLGAFQAVNKLQQDAIVAFSQEDESLLTLTASLAASVIHKIRLEQQLKIAAAGLEASQWELFSAQNALNALFENLPDALYMVDSHFHLIAINRRRKQRIPAHISGKEDRLQNPANTLCYQALFSRNSPCPDCLVKETFNTGLATQRIERRYGNMLAQAGARKNYAGEIQHARASKKSAEAEPIWTDDTVEWEIHTYPVPDRDQKIFQVILLERDITEKRQLENILTQSEKLAAMGQLAAGIAHEINNPLTAIIANAQILHRSLPIDDDLQESVDLIARAGARAVQVVRNLLDFARKEEYHLGVTHLNENLNRALELIQHELLSRGVALEFDPDPNLPPILASPDHLQSVWLNLLLNAMDALDKIPGRIRVSTRKTSDNIIVSVTDNGKGIAPERLGRIFEPFYTTKAPGRGTGLGLSVSHRIIKQHGGSIQVDSQVGKGSTFTVTLPIN